MADPGIRLPPGWRLRNGIPVPPADQQRRPLAQPPAGQPVQRGGIFVPLMRHIFAPQNRVERNVQGEIAAINAPQRPNESDAAYAARQVAGTIVRPLAEVVGTAAGAPRALIDFVSSPQQRTAIPGPSPQAPMQGRPVSRPPARVAASPASPANTPVPFQIVGVPGDHETSRLRSPAHNRRVGGSPTSWHLQGLASDRVPPPGMSMSAFAAELRRRNPGMEVINEGDHVHIEPPGSPGRSGGIAGNIQAAAGNWGAPTPGSGALDQGYQSAMGFIDQAERAALAPFTARLDESGRPDRPAPTPFQAPDFAAGDAAFEAARPQAPFENDRDRRRVQRQHYFAGMAQAMMSLDFSRGFGLGELFAKLGAGSLAGRMQGEEVIREREDRYEALMMEYNRALAGRKDGQAQQIAQTINSNIAQDNQHAQAVFGDNLQEWARNIDRIEGGNLITRRENEDGTVTQTVTPIPNAVRSAMAQTRAQMAWNYGSAQQGYQQWEWQANQSIANTALGLVLADQQQPAQAQDEAAAFGVAQRIVPLVESGAIQHLVPPEVYRDVMSRAYQANGINPQAFNDPSFRLTEEQQERVHEYIATDLTRFALDPANADFTQQLFNRRATAGGAVDRVRRTRQTQRTDSRGRTTTSTTVSGD